MPCLSDLFCSCGSTLSHSWRINISTLWERKRKFPLTCENIVKYETRNRQVVFHNKYEMRNREKQFNITSTENERLNIERLMGFYIFGSIFNFTLKFWRLVDSLGDIIGFKFQLNSVNNARDICVRTKVAKISFPKLHNFLCFLFLIFLKLWKN